MSGKSMSHILSRLSSPLDLSKHDLTPSLPQEHTHNTHTQVHFNTVSTFGRNPVGDDVGYSPRDKHQ